MDLFGGSKLSVGGSPGIKLLPTAEDYSIKQFSACGAYSSFMLCGDDGEDPVPKVIFANSSR